MFGVPLLFPCEVTPPTSSISAEKFLEIGPVLRRTFPAGNAQEAERSI